VIFVIYLNKSVVNKAIIVWFPTNIQNTGIPVQYAKNPYLFADLANQSNNPAYGNFPSGPGFCFWILTFILSKGNHKNDANNPAINDDNIKFCLVFPKYGFNLSFHYS